MAGAALRPSGSLCLARHMTEDRARPKRWHQLDLSPLIEITKDQRRCTAQRLQTRLCGGQLHLTAQPVMIVAPKRTSTTNRADPSLALFGSVSRRPCFARSPR